MILKRKTDTLASKTKTNTKQIKVTEKKNKKQPKLHGSASMRQLKAASNLPSKSIKIHHHQEIENNGNFANTLMNNKFIQEACWKVQEHDTVRESRERKSNKMRKSASAGILKSCRPARRSLSPAGGTKQIKQNKTIDIRHKYSSKHTSRSQKQFSKQKLKSFIKKTDEGHKKLVKPKQNKTQRTARNQSEHLKTDISSKMPSVHKDLEKKTVHKKNNKTVKMKDLLKVGKKSSQKDPKPQKKKAKNSIVFSDVSFNDISLNNSKKKTGHQFQNSSYERIQKITVQIRAAITIQKHFRGYLVRKYIQQLKQMTFSAIKIQKVFRGYLCRKRFQEIKKNYEEPIIAHVKKNLSIENSLITIKDFNQQNKDKEKDKDQKHKTFKFFNFDSDLSSQKKTSNICPESEGDYKNHLNTSEKEQNKKYIEILEGLLLEEGLEQKFKQRIRCSLKIQQEHEKQQKKQIYVKNKIISEISSQKSFNSPRSLCSPKNPIHFQSPNSSNNKSINKIQNLQICNSPKISGQKLNQRITSPYKQVSNSNSVKKIHYCTQKKEIQPFETNFQFIEEFQLIIVDFLRDNNQMKDQFLRRVKFCEQFRTSVVMGEWDKFEEEPKHCDGIIPKFALREQFVFPTIFDEKMKTLILEEPAMKIYLQDKNYLEAIWVYSSQQKQAYQAYINLIFDGLTEAIYRNYRSQIITKSTKFYGCMYQGHDLFKFILMNSLTYLQGWCQYQCGLQIPVDNNDCNYQAYIQKNNQRMDLAIHSELKAITENQYSSWVLWIEVMISQIIFQEIAEELVEMSFIKG